MKTCLLCGLLLIFIHNLGMWPQSNGYCGIKIATLGSEIAQTLQSNGGQKNRNGKTYAVLFHRVFY